MVPLSPATKHAAETVARIDSYSAEISPLIYFAVQRIKADGMIQMWQKKIRKVCTLRDLDHSRGSSATSACSMSVAPAEGARFVWLSTRGFSADMGFEWRPDDTTLNWWGDWNVVRGPSLGHSRVFSKTNEGRLIMHNAGAVNRVIAFFPCRCPAGFASS